MSRFWWSLILAVLVLPVLLVATMLFTETGSRALLTAADRVLPIEIDYRRGTVAGRLELGRLLWAGETLRIELQSVVAELAPDCLWRSAICFRTLQAGRLDLTLAPGPDEAEAESTAIAPSAAETATPSSPVVLPVPVEVAALTVGSTRVSWQGGEWRQGRLEGAVTISGSTVHLAPTTVRDAQLQIASSGEAETGPLSLPEIGLPLALVVDELVLEQAGWDMDGTRQDLEQLVLAGSWHNHELQLDRLQLASTAFGQWTAELALEFAGQWPLTLAADARLPEIAGWPDVLHRDITLTAGGDLAALELDVACDGEVALVARAELDVLAPGLPFDFFARADWPGNLELAGLAGVPEALAGIQLDGPFELAARGTMTEQLFQLSARGSGQGYQNVDLHIAGRHQSGLLFVEDMRVQDGGGNNTLWGSGALTYGNRLQWSLDLETGGLSLPTGVDPSAGRIEGSLRLAGSADEQAWELLLSDLNLTGTVNGLPAHLTGYAGIDSELRLSTSDLRGKLNGARLALRADGADGGSGKFELAMEDLGLWLPEGRGQLTVQGNIAADWQYIDWSGTVTDIAWSDLSAASGQLNGSYAPGQAQAFRLDLVLAQLDLAGVALTDLRLTADGTGSAQTLSLRSRGDIEGRLAVDGGFRDDGNWGGSLEATPLQTARGTWHLSEPVALDWTAASRQLRVAGHCWSYQETLVCPGEALVGEQGSASLDVSGSMDFLSEFLPPELEVAGTLRSEFTAGWSPGTAFSLDGQLQTRQVRFTRHYGAGESGTIYWDEARLALHSQTEGLAVSGEIYRDGGRILNLGLHLPQDRNEPLAGDIEFTGLQLAALEPFMPGLATLQGEVTGKLQLEGTVDQALARGQVKLAGGRLELVGNPTRLENLDVVVEMQGDWADVRGQGLLGNGPLELAGRILFRPELRAEIAVNGGKHSILVPPHSEALVSEKLNLVAADGLLDIRGELVVHEGSLQHEELPEGSVGLSGDVVEVDYKGNVVSEARPFDTSMNLMLLIDDKFQVLGDMINATLGGDLQLLQSPGQPLQLFGNLNVLGGELRAYQQRLQIKRGTISFSGTPDNPELDVRAQREISSEQVIVGLRLQGTLEQPELDVFSDPVMAQGEAMSYLVRGRGLDTGASADGLAMALSLGSGLVNRSRLVTELNRIPRLNNVAFGSEGSAEDTAATLGGYIGERLYLSYGMGLYEPINVLTARLYLHTRLWLEVVSRLENSVDLYYSFDIK